MRPISPVRLTICCAAAAIATAACGSSSPVSSIALAGALTAQTSGDSILECGAQSSSRTTDATTFELQLQLHVHASTDRLTVTIHDGIGGPGTYPVLPVHGPLIFRVYLADSVAASETSALASALRALPGVVTIRYESKDEAAAEAEATSPGIAGALATLRTNPLPASLVVSLADTRTIPTIEAMAAASPSHDASAPQSPGAGDNFGASAVADPHGIGEIALYTPEAHAAGAAAQPDYEATGTLTLNSDRRSGSVFAELVSQKGQKVGVSGSFAC